LFSSAGIDAGTQLLLKVFSRILDDDKAAGKNLPRRLLDSGCGCGVIGICAAKAITTNDVQIRCQDRDELARLLTLHNAEKNGVSPAALEAYTEPLLAGPDSGRWDMILTNIPAKAGPPVLEDFIRRSAGLLNPGGRVLMVAVQPLADFFRERIAADAELLGEHQGSGHTVFVYGGKAAELPAAIPVHTGTSFYARYPFYARAAVTCQIEDIPIHLETIHGASGFNHPGGEVLAAAKLTARLKKTAPQQFPFDGNAPLLIHEPGQGFFPCWLLEFLDGKTRPMVLSGRNILALEAARHNVQRHNAAVSIIPAADLSLGRTALLEAVGGRQYGFIAAFPELLPQSSLPKTAKGNQGNSQLAALWDALPPLLADDGIFLAAFGSSDAERFDRKKPPDFTRLASVKRNGFRALAYRSKAR
jgi:hypothetical protein